MASGDSGKPGGAGAGQEPLLPRVAAGDAAAVQRCIDRYKGLLWWLARQMATADPEDAVQELFIELWQNAGRYDPGRSSEPAFVAMVARRRLIDRRRRRDRRPTEEALDDGYRELRGTDGRQVESCAEASLAAEAIGRLRPEERRVVLLSVVQGFSHSEIADRTELPLGTVKTYVRRGLARVREMLAGQEAGQARPGQEAAS